VEHRGAHSSLSKQPHCTKYTHTHIDSYISIINIKFCTKKVNAQPEKNQSQMPLLVKNRGQCSMEECHCKTVIEEAKNKDRVHSF
jgi:hypothetical protein